MRFGAASADLTPAPGTRFGGFWQERRHGADGVHDPLLASALLVGADDGSTVALVSTDLQLISRPAVDEVRRRLRSEWGIAPEAVLVHATHNHAAPGGDWAEAFVAGAGDYFAAPEVEERVIAAIVEAVREAFTRQVAARLMYAGGEVAGIGRFRHDATRPQRAPASLVWAQADDGSRPFVAAFYGCHASVLGPDNRLFSADFPAVVRRALADWAGGSATLYFNTAAADVSTRHTRKTQDFAEVERLGGRLAGELVALAAAGREIRQAGLVAREAVVTLALCPREAAPDGPAGQLRQRLVGDAVDCRLQWLEVGGLAIVGVEAEVGLDLGLAIAAASGRDDVVVVAPAGGSVGNVPSSLFAPAASSALVAAAGALGSR